MCYARRRWSFAPATTRVGSTAPSAVAASVLVRALPFLPFLFPPYVLCQLRVSARKVDAAGCRPTLRPRALCRHRLRPPPRLRRRDPFGLAGRRMGAVQCDICAVHRRGHRVHHAAWHQLHCRQQSHRPAARRHSPNLPSRPPACLPSHIPVAAPLRKGRRIPRALAMPRICLPWQAWAARGVAAEVLGRRRVRTGECGRASAARWRARARARAGRSGCPRLCEPRHPPR